MGVPKGWGDSCDGCRETRISAQLGRVRQTNDINTRILMIVKSQLLWKDEDLQNKATQKSVKEVRKLHKYREGLG